MKTTATSTITTLILASAALAGEPPSSKMVTPATPAPDPLTWFAGAAGGYLLDKDEPIYSLQFGVRKSIPGSDCAHALYLEIGYAEYDENINFGDFGFGPGGAGSFDTEIVPITLNYRYECAITNRLSWYGAIGAGVAFIDSDYDGSQRRNRFSASDDDEVFFAQATVGVTYALTENFRTNLGVTYAYMDTPSLSYGNLGLGSIDLARRSTSAVSDPGYGYGGGSTSADLGSALSHHAEDAADLDGEWIISLGFTYDF